jgi:RHH-type transcriptional regulator, proline utilization regulon repressor / proline dehydrogenase / delta 1-pyrroline-5-carboxylate dehydrogenase
MFFKEFSMVDSHYMSKAREKLKEVEGKALSVEARREIAIELAALMINESRRIQSYSERVQQEQLARMMEDPEGKDFTTTVTDECFRGYSNRRIADQLTYILDKYGIPKFLSMKKKVELKTFKYLGTKMASVFVPLAKKMIRRETSRVILPAEKSRLKKHIRSRRAEGVRVNINHLGEAILGEDEALRRLELYLDDLSRPEIEYISVKISTICSQLNLLARDQTLEILAERLRRLYRQAAGHQFVRPDGTSVSKFVNLDMEEYRDLHLTVAVFRKVLDEPEFFHHSAGIVLQAYLPDAYLYQQELTLWALQRVASGGAPIKIRIVKGANLAMEQLESRLRHWPQAPYLHKVDVDANFKRMVAYGCQGEYAPAVNLGIASHNLFDIAYALLIRAENQVEEHVSFEMLEGMADPMRRVVQSVANDMLLYCPVAFESEFQHAVAYLVRRLDENTAPENFLRHAFDLIPGTRDWQQQASLFSLSCHAAGSVSFKPRRTQNRLIEPSKAEQAQDFQNEPDTDWSLPQNCKWAEEIVRKWQSREYEAIPLVINGKEVLPSSKNDVSSRPVRDPSRPDAVLCEMSQASQTLVDEALKTAESMETEWAALPVSDRSDLLFDAAENLRQKRGDLIGAMIAAGGKLIPESDTEISEAIDFIEYYRRRMVEMEAMPDVRWHSKGTTVILPPWNFPCAIPTGGVAAALAAGNPVIFKPAPEATLIGYEIAKAFWDAGISKKVLQFVPCKDEPVGSYLIQNPLVKKVILTGGTETAKLLLRLRPGLDLCAETGGKNSIIVTSMADRDLAIKDIVHSAFSHAGQKCSACSLLILEKDVYQDKHFLQQLADAAKSLKVGSAWDLSTKLNPLINVPNETLKSGLTTLEKGESWLLEPKQDPENPRLWSPGIKIGVKPGTYSHQTEFFGPVLSIMRAESLEQAVQIANDVPYGLTSGLQTLDEREQKFWLENIEAGNCYINRGITGAIVRRQPFGGFKASSFGSGNKAGGPNYLMSFMTPEQTANPEDAGAAEAVNASLSCYMESRLQGDALKLWHSSVGSYLRSWNAVFSKDHDPSAILGQDNILRYVPRKLVALRIGENDEELDIFRVAAAAQICGTPLELSYGFDRFDETASLDWWKQISGIKIIKETDEDLIKRLADLPEKRIRLLSPPSEALAKGFADAACSLLSAPVMASGRVELLNYLREMSISYDYHRYGNIAYKDASKRQP